MAISYQIHKDQRLIVVTTSGEIDLDATIQSLEQLFNDPEYAPEYDLLWDDTERATILTCDDIQKIAQHFKYYRGDKPPKRAFVVSRTVKYGVTSVYSSMTSIRSQAQIGIFQDRKEALQWLEHLGSGDHG